MTPAKKAWTVHEIRSLGVRTDLVTAAEILGIGRTAAHEMARRNEFPVPVLRIGRKYSVPVAPLLELLHIDQPEPPEPSAAIPHHTPAHPRRPRRRRAPRRTQ